MTNVWDDAAVGEAAGFRLAVVRSRDDPPRWAVLVDTPLLHLWVAVTDPTVVREALTFVERTRGRRSPVRLGMTVGTFCGRQVRLTKDDEAERYDLDLLGPVDADAGRGVSDGCFLLRVEEGQQAAVLSALRQAADAPD